MLRRLVVLALIAAVVGFGVFWVVTIPATVPASALASHTPNLDNGRVLFLIGGCASCHATPGQEDKAKLGGGVGLKSPFGTFYTPNISPDPSEGIGKWTEANFVTAMVKGTSPDGRHYFPAFPYTSYQRIGTGDLRDLFAYLKTLPAVQDKSRPHDVPFPFNIRRSLGGWKFLFLDGKPYEGDPTKDVVWNRGAYLVNGPGHCAECHSPRNILGGIIASQRFAGGPSPDGEGFVPNITQKGLTLSQEQLVKLLETGETPDGDSVGGEMGKVVANTAKLSPEDRTAIATYVKSLPPIDGPKPPEPNSLGDCDAPRKRGILFLGGTMNLVKAFLLKAFSALLFALLSACVRYLGEQSVPLGEVVFFRAAFAIVPVLLIDAWRHELADVIRTERPLGHLLRGAISVAGMFLNFAALARLPLVDATAISFAAPLITVAFAAWFLGERVRIYRWSAVAVGFAGIIVMLWPYLNLAQYTAGGSATVAATVGVVCGLTAAFTNAGSVIQTRRLTDTETTSSIVFYFSLFCAIAGLATLPFGWIWPSGMQLAVLIASGLIGGLAHIVLTSSYRYAPASLVAPLDYTTMIWAFVLGYAIFGEVPTVYVFVGGAIVAASGIFVIWRERQLGLRRIREAEGPANIS